MKASDMATLNQPLPDEDVEDEGPQVGLADLLTWLGEGKRHIAIATAAATGLAVIVALSITAIYTARTSLLPPGSQQQSTSAAALAALGSLGNLAGGATGGLSKTPDEMYVALLKSDSVTRALDQRFDLKKHYAVKEYETLRKVFPEHVHISSDKKSGVISVEVDDKDPKFAAELANAFPDELSKLMSRLAVSEAQQRRRFYEQQLRDTKEHLIKAEQDLRQVQEKSGVIVLDKQAEALILGAAQLRALIAEREVQLKVLRTAATEQNADVMRFNSELQALRGELARMESKQDGASGSVVDMPVGKIPAAAIDYVRARRELKLQETLLEGIVRQYEIAKLDEAKEGTTLQQVDKAVPPDYKSKPSRGLIVLGGMLLGLLAASAVVVWRRYSALVRADNPQSAAAWQSVRKAWRLRG
jgi:uncharacterized protein involved in exopolysaccharide biosynthesis